MADANFSSSVEVKVAPQRAFEVVTSDIEGWWSDVVAGGCAKDQTCAVVFGKAAKILKTIERDEAERLVWHCVDVLMENPDSEYPAEWRGTRMLWTFEPTTDGCRITLTHVGLTPKLDCYETCEKAWTFFVTDSLKAYLETGMGDPHRNRNTDI